MRVRPYFLLAKKRADRMTIRTSKMDTSGPDGSDLDKVVRYVNQMVSFALGCS